MDLESQKRWVEYSKAKDEMFVHTDIHEAPWHVVESEIKRNARINCITHLLSQIPYEHREPERIKLPKRQDDTGYVRPPLGTNAYVPDAAAQLLASTNSKPRRSKASTNSKPRKKAKSKK
jgi:hypothetical protein